MIHIWGQSQHPRIPILSHTSPCTAFAYTHNLWHASLYDPIPTDLWKPSFSKEMAAHANLAADLTVAAKRSCICPSARLTIKSLPQVCGFGIEGLRTPTCREPTDRYDYKGILSVPYEGFCRDCLAKCPYEAPHPPNSEDCPSTRQNCTGNVEKTWPKYTSVTTPAGTLGMLVVKAVACFRGRIA